MAFVGPGPTDVDDASTVMYVATTAAEGHLRDRVPAVGSINLQGSRTMMVSYQDAFLTYHGTKVVYDVREEAVLPHNKIEYVAGFSIEGFSYFFTQQPNQFTQNQLPETTTLSKIVQVCQNDKSYNSYIEVPIKCEHDVYTFDLVEVVKNHITCIDSQRRRPCCSGTFQ